MIKKKSKKMIVFAIFLALGIILFGLTYLSQPSPLLQVIFLITYLLMLTLNTKKHSHFKLIMLVIVVIVYVTLLITPFSECDVWKSSTEISKECQCLGLKKFERSNLIEGKNSQCIGKIKKIEEKTPQQRLREKLITKLNKSEDLIIVYPEKLVLKQRGKDFLYLGVKNNLDKELEFTLELDITTYKGTIDENSTHALLSFDKFYYLNSSEIEVYNLMINAVNEIKEYPAKIIIRNSENKSIYAEKEFMIEIEELKIELPEPVFQQ